MFLSWLILTSTYCFSDFELKTLTLKTELMEGKKTGEKIKEAIDETKKEFALCDKKLFLVTDAGSNVKRAVRLANTESHLCLGHGLHNLVTIDGIKKVPEIDTLVTKCKKIVKAVRYRLPDLEKDADSQVQYFRSLENAARTIEDDENDPIFDEEEEQDSFTENDEQHNRFGRLDHVPSIKSATPTRWHSVLEMLESMIHCCNRSPINEMLQKIGQSDLRITQSDWNVLEDLVKFLSKFREAVTILSSQKACTLNVALVFKSEIKDVLNSIPDDETLIMLSLKRNMMKQVDKRFPTTKATVAAALLDYRFMGLTEIDMYLESQNMTRASFLAGYFKEIVGTSESDTTQAVVPSTSTVPVRKTKDTSSSQLLLKLAKKHCSYNSTGFQNEDAIDQETWKYLAAADPTELNDDGDLLSFWKKRTTSFPLLSTLARAMLCVPATSTPSERVFSVAGLVLTAKRSRLMPQRVNKIIFIHDNYHVCKDGCSVIADVDD